MPAESPPGHVADPSHLVAADVRFAGHGGDEIRGFHVRPAGDGPFPGLVVVHQAGGLDPHTRDIAQRFANVGYSVLAPDLYSRGGGPTPDDDLPAIVAKMFAIPDDRALGDLEGAAAFLRAGAEATGRVGAIGFCAGGRHTLLFACSTDALDAAVDCWGGFADRADPDHVSTALRPTPPLDLVDRLTCPLMAAIGAEDANPSPAVGEELRRRLERVAVPSRVDVYEGAGHAFFADVRPSYEPKAARLLWERVLPFLEEHLGG